MGIEEVYDSLIPAVSTAPAGLSGMNVIVRYIPGDTSVDRELKIELTRTNGSTRMMVWAPAGRSIYGQLRELRQSRPDQCDDVLMRAIQIQRGSKEGEAMEIKVVPVGSGFQAVILTCEGSPRPMHIVPLGVTGSDVSFSVREDEDTSWSFRGMVSAASLKGTVTHSLGGSETVILPRRCGYWDRR